ncbi:MAG TPA: hybrid sensor histidine kinase/response regulator, partial [Dokdonella sp.]
MSRALTSVAAAPLRRVKCLLVDDLEDNLLALSTLLESDEVQVLTARSGLEALELLLVHDVALALVDVQMPQMDGFELAELMRGTERTRQVPIIFLTAGTHDRQRLFKGYEAGAVDFLYKPIEPHVLRSKAEVFFQLYRQKHQLAEELAHRTETLRLNEMFVAVLGHDLRNPLSAIIMGFEVIDHWSPEGPVKDLATRTLTSALRMSRMIEDLLDLSRARLGAGIPISRCETDLETLVERAIDEHRATRQDRPIHFRHSGDPTGVWDPDRLLQVVSNLLGNALQHGSGGPVDVVLDGTGADTVFLTITNDGIIAADDRAELFDPFRSGKRGDDSAAGLGLGLYIVQQIVLAHGGAVRVDSHN